jgi:D-aminopeptidase
VGETNDGWLNDIRKRALTSDMIRQAIVTAGEGPVEEGAVGAGTGTVAFGWKGGIGSSSRRLPESLGSYTVGALVQSNFGGVLQILGAPLGLELGRYAFKDELATPGVDGSIMIVLATDAPLSDRNLSRLARRALAGLARTGAAMSNGSGDYALAFSTAEEVRRTPRRRSRLAGMRELPNERVSPLFLAAIETAEEAIYNSLLQAVTVSGYHGHIAEALPVDKLVQSLRRHGML